MCNLYAQTRSVDEIGRLFRGLQMPLRFPEGAPNLAPKEICITDPAPIVRAAAGEPEEFELIIRRWSWPGPGGKPVYNFRSDGRQFPSGRCLILADGFFEFTAPADTKKKRKDRWLFTLANGEPMGIAGLVRTAADVGEAFTMLTTEPGPDVAPYHNRQVCVLAAADWKAWLEHRVPERELLGPLPPGTLQVKESPR